MSDELFTPAQEARIKELIRAALRRPIRIEIAALGPLYIEAETFALAVDPEIERRLDAGATPPLPDQQAP